MYLQVRYTAACDTLNTQFKIFRFSIMYKPFWRRISRNGHRCHLFSIAFLDIKIFQIFLAFSLTKFFPRFIHPFCVKILA